MYPIKLAPALKDYLWGGTRLKTEYNKKSDLEKVAESWELSCHKDGNSVIQNGCYAGKTLAEYVQQAGKQVLGSNCDSFEYFPILIKLIDAKDNLSVQVHPNNDYAKRVEGEYGKTEMWYVVDCNPGASLLYGFQKEISKEEFANRIADNTLLEVTNAVPVKKGDVFFIEAGTLHAIGAGILIAEIQQNSNTTYRIYDYGRVGADGKPRALHVEKAMDVTALCPAPKSHCQPQGEPQIHAQYTDTLLASCGYFTVNRIDLDGSADFAADQTSFVCLLNLQNPVTVKTKEETITLLKGETAFLPAGLGEYTLCGTSQIIVSRV